MSIEDGRKAYADRFRRPESTTERTFTVAELKGSGLARGAALRAAQRGNESARKALRALGEEPRESGASYDDLGGDAA